MYSIRMPQSIVSSCPTQWTVCVQFTEPVMSTQTTVSTQPIMFVQSAVSAEPDMSVQSTVSTQPVMSVQSITPTEPIMSTQSMAQIKSNPSSDSQNVEQVLLELVKSLSDQVNLGRLPAPKPAVFTGDPLNYPGWKIDFTTLIEQRKVPPTERIHYLKSILVVQPKMTLKTTSFLHLIMLMKRRRNFSMRCICCGQHFP